MKTRRTTQKKTAIHGATPEVAKSGEATNKKCSSRDLANTSRDADQTDIAAKSGSSTNTSRAETNSKDDNTNPLDLDYYDSRISQLRQKMINHESDLNLIKSVSYNNNKKKKKRTYFFFSNRIIRLTRKIRFNPKFI